MRGGPIHLVILRARTFRNALANASFQEMSSTACQRHRHIAVPKVGSRAGVPLPYMDPACAVLSTQSYERDLVGSNSKSLIKAARNQ